MDNQTILFYSIYTSSEKRPLISDHIKRPLVAAFRSPLMKALDRSVETLGLWIVTSSVTFIKSANQSSIKLCLISQWAICYRCSRRPGDFLVLSSNNRTSTSFTLVKRNDFFFSVHITRGKVIYSEKFRCKLSWKIALDLSAMLEPTRRAISICGSKLSCCARSLGFSVENFR